MKLVVNIEDRHIRQGKRGDCDRCPIVFAMRDLGYECEVTPMDMVYIATVPKDGQWERFYDAPLPDKARCFVRDFDVHGPAKVAPMSFELELDAA